MHQQQCKAFPAAEMQIAFKPEQERGDTGTASQLFVRTQPTVLTIILKI